MEEKDIKTVKTTRGELRYYRDWGNYDGGCCNAERPNYRPLQGDQE